MMSYYIFVSDIADLLFTGGAVYGPQRGAEWYQADGEGGLCTGLHPGISGSLAGIPPHFKNTCKHHLLRNISHQLCIS